MKWGRTEEQKRTMRCAFMGDLRHGLLYYYSTTEHMLFPRLVYSFLPSRFEIT